MTVMKLPPGWLSIELSDAERTRCTEVGHARQAAHEQAYGTDDGLPADGRFFNRTSSTQLNVDGATSEYAIAKMFNLAWSAKLWTREEFAIERHLTADVDEDIQVKCHNLSDYGLLQQDLLVRFTERKNNDFLFVLTLLHLLPTVIVAGWCTGSQVMAPAHAAPWLPVPCWRVTWRHRNPMDTFEAHLQSPERAATLDNIRVRRARFLRGVPSAYLQAREKQS
jgi:hypothetical protein